VIASISPARHAVAFGLTIGSLLIAGVATLVTMVALAASPRSGDHRFIVVYPPWTAPAEAVKAAVSAGGHLLGFPGPSFMVAIETRDQRFVARARTGGAVLIVAARKAFGCSHGDGDPNS